VASSTACIQNNFNGSAALYLRCLSRDASLYPVFSSIENLSISNVASCFSAMISPDMDLFPKLTCATLPLPGLRQK